MEASRSIVSHRHCLPPSPQILIGIVILIKSRYNINDEEHHKAADALNNSVVYLVFAVTVVNVFVSAFGIDPGFSVQRALYERDSLMPRLVVNGTTN